MSDSIKKRLRMMDIVGTVAILALLGGSAALAVVPLYRDGVKNIAESKHMREQLSELDGLSKTLQQVETERKQTESRLAEAEARLPSSNEMDKFMEQLAGVATKAGLQVDSITPGKNLSDDGGYKSTPVQITGIGDWDTCYKFLTGLKSMSRLTRLDSLSLELQKDAGDAGGSYGGSRPICQISVGISTFMAR